MTTQLDSAQDVVAFLKAQHEQIKKLFTKVKQSKGEHREEAFVELRRLLAVHETAEEEIVHPRARHQLADGSAVVDARLHEEHEAKKALAALEKLNVNSTRIRDEVCEPASRRACPRRGGRERGVCPTRG